MQQKVGVRKGRCANSIDNIQLTSIFSRSNEGEIEKMSWAKSGMYYLVLSGRSKEAFVKPKTVN